MSEVDESNNNSGGEDQDPILNMKAEFQRKTDNLSAQLAEQNRKMEEMIQSVISANTQRAEPTRQAKPLGERLFEDADGVANEITQRAIAAASQVVDQRVAQSQASQQVVQEVMAKYPEFGQAGGEAALKALEIARSQPKHLQGTAEGAKMAMLEAAAELGLTPMKARRQQGSDDFTMPGRSGGSGGRTPKESKSKVAAESLEFAQLLGVDVSDPKALKGIEEASGRTKWSTYK